MNKKSLIKYYHENETGLMHYVIFDGDVVVLSAQDSKKVDYINENGNLNITFDIKSDDYGVVDVKIINDKNYRSCYWLTKKSNGASFRQAAINP